MAETEEQTRRRIEPLAPASMILLVASLVIAAAGHWRGGVDLLGITMVAAGTARLVLPRKRLGLLAVRHRAVDSLLLIGTGAALIVLVYIVPTQ